MADAANDIIISITVLYFASAQTAVGVQRERVELPGADFPLSNLAAVLTKRHPVRGLEEVLRASQWSVDEEMVSPEAVQDTKLKGGECVAVIPPVSGG
ncbi:MoaD/ThiS [Exidia glandulosa HHB12029]|uniref:MoaD/ThiS n=1 Tax=Exidia glandulosa HHB12029 TaxID=1314781 RepID=A0A165CU50_EXIGL|nr:MoaD/ThiS [Exidia glandulosa HHB12029]